MGIATKFEPPRFVALSGGGAEGISFRAEPRGVLSARTDRPGNRHEIRAATFLATLHGELVLMPPQLSEVMEGRLGRTGMAGSIYGF